MTTTTLMNTSTNNQSSFIGRNGMTVILNSVKLTDLGNGYTTYDISYTERNLTAKAIDQATFNLYFDNSESLTQYGSFGKVLPGKAFETTRFYTFTAETSANAIILEYDSDHFFAKAPIDGSLQWKFDGNKLDWLSSSPINNSSTTPINSLPTGSITVSGDTQQGKTLTASNTLEDLDGLGTISYQWLSGDAVISGANQTSYTLTAADVNKAISVKASYTDLQNTAESVTSTKTPLVTSNASSKPTNGDDKLIGTAKNDTLNGGFGFDELTGGTGADKFVYKSIKDAPVSHSKVEVITDFSNFEKDKIDLSKIDADTSKAKDQAFSKPEIGVEFSGVFTKAGQLFFDTTNHVLYGNVNADETADFAIQLNGVSSLVAGDFIL